MTIIDFIGSWEKNCRLESIKKSKFDPKVSDCSFLLSGECEFTENQKFNSDKKLIFN